MSYLGSRTKNTGTWLLPDDEAAFDRALFDRIPSRAWECDHPGPAELHPRHLHSSLQGALRCGRLQAFLHLPFDPSQPPTPAERDIVLQPTRPPIEASIQYLQARHRSQHGEEHFEAGRLAVRWFEDSVDEQMHQLLTEQAKLVWSALTASTRPAKIEDTHGRPLSGHRIGDAALALVRETGLLLSRPGLQLFRLR